MLRYLLFLIFVFFVTDGYCQSFAWVSQGTGSYANKVASDKKGHIFTSDDRSVTKWDSNGNFIWRTPVPASYIYDIVCDGSGNLYAAGVFTGKLSIGNITATSDHDTYNMYLTKLTADGSVAWIKQSHSNGWSGASGLAIDDKDELVVIGRFMKDISLDSFKFAGPNTSQIFLAKYSSSGNCIWAQHVKSQSFGGGGIVPKVRTDRAANIYISGHFLIDADFGALHVVAHQSSDQDIFLAKCDPSGNFQWAQTLGGNRQEIFGSFDVDDAGNSYVSGYFSSKIAYFGQYSLTTVQYDYFTARYTAQGTCVWAQTGGADAISAISDGYYTNSPEFINKRDSSGKTVWTKSVNGRAYNQAMSAVSNAVFITGTDSGTVVFDTCSVRSRQWSMYLTKLSVPNSPLQTRGDLKNISFSVYPNPAKGSLKISVATRSNACQLRISNALGENVYSQIVAQAYEEINIENFPRGIYIVEIIADDKSFTKKIIVE